MKTGSSCENLLRFLRVAESAAVKAGNLLVEKMGTVSIQEKNPGDFVTEADIESERIIRQAITCEFPTHGFLGEESANQGPVGTAADEFCWIVDPLDGTTNYIHQLRSFSVSIALKAGDHALVGCVRDPILDETYTAMRGVGAFLNGQPIRPSSVSTCDRAIAAVSLSSQIRRDSPELEQLINVLVDSEVTVRRLGSTALNLCYLACGRLDAYWSSHARIWDVAAGVLILAEAGGTIRHPADQPFDWEDTCFIATSNPQLWADLQRFLSLE